MALLEACQYTPVSKAYTLEATYYLFDSRDFISGMSKYSLPHPVLRHPRKLYIDCSDGVRLPSQNCSRGPVVLSPDDSDVNL
jgi:hypothetical protein